MEKLITVQEASEILGATVGTIYVWKCHHQIPFHKLRGKLKFRPSELEEWLNAKTPATASPRSKPAKQGKVTRRGKGGKAIDDLVADAKREVLPN